MARLKLLILPSLIFGLVLAVAFQHWSLINSPIADGDLLLRILGGSLEIGLIAASAFLLLRLTNVFFWYGIVGNLMGKKVPKLATDFTAILIFFWCFRIYPF